MNSIEYFIAIDFLKKLTRVKRISSPRPTAKDIRELCIKCYPGPTGMHYKIADRHITEAADFLAIPVKKNHRGISVGVIATELKHWQQGHVFNDEIICAHGPVKYTLFYDGTTQKSAVKPICPKCRDGFQLPTDELVRKAEQWLVDPDTVKVTLPMGAICIAAKKLGYNISTAGGVMRVSKIKKSGAT